MSAFLGSRHPNELHHNEDVSTFRKKKSNELVQRQKTRALPLQTLLLLLSGRARPCVESITRLGAKKE